MGVISPSLKLVAELQNLKSNFEVQQPTCASVKSALFIDFTNTQSVNVVLP